MNAKIRDSKKAVLIKVMLFLILFAICGKAETVKAEMVSGFWKYEVKMDGTIRLTGYTGAASSVKVPGKIAGKTVTELGGYWGVVNSRGTFMGNKYVVSIKLPSSIKTIGSCAFMDCENLKKVTGLENVTSIGDCAFNECKKLSSVKFGNDLNTIGGYAFEDCRILKNISFPAGVSEIGTKAFYNCKSLTEVVFPSKLEDMGDNVFSNCKNLKKVILKGNAWIGEECFRDCVSLNQVKIVNGVPGIGGSAFAGCKSLKSIYIPGSVYSVGGYAFYRCTSLTKVTFGFGVVRVGGTLCDAVFTDCPALSEVNIPNSVQQFGFAYETDTKLKSITIPNSVKEIGDMEKYTHENLLIKCYKGSYAEQYAKEKGFKYTLLTARKAKKLSFSKRTIYLNVDDRYKVSYKISPSNTTDAITWESSDDKIAYVDAVGEVKAKSVGSATIIGTTTSGKRATINVVVSNKPTSIAFANASKRVVVGKTVTQRAIVKDITGIRKDVKPTYSSSNKSVATVSKSGKVKALKPGKTVIKARTAGLTAKYVVTVVKK